MDEGKSVVFYLFIYPSEQNLTGVILKWAMACLISWIRA